MLAGFHAHCVTSPTATELKKVKEDDNYAEIGLPIQLKLETEYLSKYAPQYASPFFRFSFLRNTMQHPRHHESATSIFANAIGQFALNTDILSVLSNVLAGEGPPDAYYIAKENHPDQRLNILVQAVYADRAAAIAALRRIWNEKLSALAALGISIDQSGELPFGGLETPKKAALFDWLNNIFLVWACCVSGLNVAAHHSFEIARQFDDLLLRHQSLFSSQRLNVSLHPNRWDFVPTVRDFG